MKIRNMQRHICGKYSYQRHIRKIMPFDNHLCADQDICLLIGKCMQNLLISILGSCGIKIHTHHTCLWKSLPHQHLNLLRARLESA